MRLYVGAALLVLLPSMVAADDGFAGISYTQLDQNDRFFGDDNFDTGEVFGRLGAAINDYFSAEMRLGTTLADKSEGGGEYRFNYHVGGYVSLGYSFGNIRPYVMAGYTFGEEEIEVAGEAHSDTIDDLSYGVGADVIFGEHLGANVEYTQYYDIGNVTYKGPSVGLVYQF